MFDSRQSEIFREAFDAYSNFSKILKDGERYIEKGQEAEDIPLTCLFDLQLQKILFELSMTFEKELNDSEKEFLSSIIENAEELKQSVPGYRSFCRNMGSGDFSKMDPGIMSSISDLPYCIEVGVAMDRKYSGTSTNYCYEKFIIIIAAYAAIEEKGKQGRRKSAEKYIKELGRRIKDRYSRFDPSDSSQLLSRLFNMTVERAGIPDEEKTFEDIYRELKDMIGLKEVKLNVEKMLKVLKVREERKRRGMNVATISLHMVFTGNPGTGKTTVARLLARIYKKMGILDTGQLVEADRSALVGGYVGQTEEKTRKVIESALGGILFIDEAYALADGQGSNDYGKEVISTLLKAMEDYRDNLAVIVAGYPGKMKAFIDSNPGLKSRFNNVIEFRDYGPAEMKQIYEYLCDKQGYSQLAECNAIVEEKIYEHWSNRGENYANGRDVRNFFEKVVVNQSERIAAGFDNLEEIEDDELNMILPSDVENVEF